MASSKKYAVFISFRGEDVRDNFASHLYDALTRNKIHTFDDERLERGDEISPALLKAIQGSDLSVIIFSENYASSTWCLEELVHILECNKEHGQTVIPVFYRVDPSDVRKQKGSYATAFAELEKRFENRMDKVRQWRAALTEATEHSGWDSRAKRESKLIEEIIQDILKKMKHKLHISEEKGLVGIEERFKKIESLLCIDSPDVRFIGIWGMGGIGKTTLAAAVFRRLYSQFESCYFLPNVREESEKREGLNHLREKLISELLGEKKTNRGCPLVEYGSTEYRLRQMRVLIVVDDVNDSKQIDSLVGDRDRFGNGSRIILTARNVQVLRKVADEIYRVVGLNSSEALYLLCSNAFKGNTVGTENLVLSRRVVGYARGNPLAIKVLGSVLYSKSKEEWESTLNKLEKVPNKDIQSVLRISYGELDDEEQDIFLDIACFFEGYHLDFVKGILDGCGFFASTGIQNLIDKSLVTINKYIFCLGMHDLLQEMGREIVREESIKQPGDRSRLWRVEDIRQVFTRNTGSDKVEGIFLDTCGMKEIILSPEVFSKMQNLRLLKIVDSSVEQKLKFPQGLQSLPGALAYLYWVGCPLKSLPSDFSPENIVVLQMPNSQLEQLWDGVQELGNLKQIDISWSPQLTQIPNLSLAPNLEEVNLQGCKSLNEVPWYFQDRLTSLNLSNTAIEVIPSSIQRLSGLLYLDLTDCERLKSLPTSICKLKSLKTISLSDCSQLESFPKILEPMEGLKKLYLDGTAIKRLHSSIEYLFNLEVLSLSSCKNLEFVPIRISHLSNLTNLSFDGCSKLERLPPLYCGKPYLFALQPYQRDWDVSESHWLKSLTSMDLSGTNIEKLPKSIELLSLKYLELSNCKRLKSLPKLPNVLQLLADDCTSLETVSSSRTELIRDWEGDRMRVIEEKEEEAVNFLNCLNLDQTAKRNIMADAELRIRRQAAKESCFINKSASYAFEEPSVCVCCPGSEIPKWFMYQTAGTSVNIKLPLHWFNNFLGFALCIVANFDGDDKDDGFTETRYLRCETRFKTSNGGESHRFYSFLEFCGEKGKVNSDHVFQWYNYYLNDKVKSSWFTTSLHNHDDITEVEFYFYPEYFKYGKQVCCCTVKHCGICLLNEQDAENAISSNQDKQEEEEEEEEDEDEEEENDEEEDEEEEDEEEDEEEEEEEEEVEEVEEEEEEEERKEQLHPKNVKRESNFQ